MYIEAAYAASNFLDNIKLPEWQLYRHSRRSAARKAARMAALSALPPVCGAKSCPNGSFIGTPAGLRREKLPEWQLYRHSRRSAARKAARMAALSALPPVCGMESRRNGNFVGEISSAAPQKNNGRMRDTAAQSASGLPRQAEPGRESMPSCQS
ncbi:hypothetical protein GXP70_20595 [Paenibacillus lycopersici]|uniref:Uncharacterized protein n=1 Tax=Paenibacillus lycopersici TaxID=2704462 RepID=A0A6C0G339_9BACL|nr:hypothetical protein [Paenibacillus lycopersici]QHT62141.1 hypothetical protein GXP70_20595 [Paenibacillus lycopersici]